MAECFVKNSCIDANNLEVVQMKTNELQPEQSALITKVKHVVEQSSCKLQQQQNAKAKIIKLLGKQKVKRHVDKIYENEQRK